VAPGQKIGKMSNRKRDKKSSLIKNRGRQEIIKKGTGKEKAHRFIFKVYKDISLKIREVWIRVHNQKNIPVDFKFLPVDLTFLPVDL
jgi:hypothetical protein